MRIATKLGLVTGLLAMLAWSSASAQQAAQAPEEEPPQRLGLLEGLTVMVGGGVHGFTDSNMRDFTSTGGSWEVRGVGNTRRMIGGELAYVGSVQDIDAIGLDDDALLLGTTFEAAGRVNLLPEAVWTPYAVAGLGYTRYSIRNESFNTSNIRSSDNMLSIPLSLGMAYNYQRLLLDARATYRHALDDDLVPEAALATGEDVDQNSWGVTARIGFEF